MLILENGEILIEKKKASKDTKKQTIKKAPKKEPKYAVTYNQDLNGTKIDINFGIFVEEFVDEKERTKVKIRDGYSLVIKEFECHAFPIKGDAYILGSKKTNVRLISASDYKKLCNIAMEVNNATESLLNLVQNYFVGQEFDESEFYIFDSKDDNMWFFQGAKGENDNEDLLMYLETDRAYRISDTIGIVSIYKGFEIENKSEYAYIDKSTFNKLVKQHTAIIKMYKDLRDTCKSFFEK